MIYTNPTDRPRVVDAAARLQRVRAADNPGSPSLSEALPERTPFAAQEKALAMALCGPNKKAK